MLSGPEPRGPESGTSSFRSYPKGLRPEPGTKHSGSFLIGRVVTWLGGSVDWLFAGGLRLPWPIVMAAGHDK
jgi:hypothetical protein